MINKKNKLSLMSSRDNGSDQLVRTMDHAQLICIRRILHEQDTNCLIEVIGSEFGRM